jgi:transcriptional regulator with XRE-family HTH domain
MPEIGEKISNRRKELGLTLEQVGDEVGVGKSTVRKWEKGMIKNMGSDKIAKLAKVLQLRSVDLVPKADHSIGMDLSPTEREIIIAYRKAKEGTRESVRKLLDVEEKTPAVTAI